MSRYFCSDSKEDMLNLIAAVVQAKVRVSHATHDRSLL